MPSPPDLLIAGASARAAAFSAVRAGLTVVAADLFADRDLAAVADVTPITDWPHGIESWAARFPAHVPLVYVGGLENEPALLHRLATSRPLFGNVGDLLERSRSPEQLACLFREAGLRFPALSPPHSDSQRRWLIKPVRSAAGRGVRLWKGRDDELRSGEYLQEFLEGLPGSAAYLLTETGPELLGTTELLLPDSPPLTNTAPFTYLGSITTDTADPELPLIGEALTRIGLRGLVGVDFIRTADGLAPIEVNPRYTAGMEVLEQRFGCSFIAEHFRAFGGSTGHSPSPASVDRPRPHFGKRIVYAPHAVRVPELPLPTQSEIAEGRYGTADVPAPGSIVAAGEPICTVLTYATSVAACREELRGREHELLRRCEPV